VCYYLPDPSRRRSTALRGESLQAPVRPPFFEYLYLLTALTWLTAAARVLELCRSRTLTRGDSCAGHAETELRHGLGLEISQLLSP